MENNNSSFSFSYSAKEREEIERIRNKYTHKEAPGEDKMQRLRDLDRRAEGHAKCIALVLGIIGSLILGTGMSFIMTDLGSVLGLDLTKSLVLGLISGVVGMITCAIAYPVYKKALASAQKKLAPEILSLSDELLR
jgi:hypothetical protein